MSSSNLGTLTSTGVGVLTFETFKVYYVCNVRGGRVTKEKIRAEHGHEADDVATAFVAAVTL